MTATCDGFSDEWRFYGILKEILADGSSDTSQTS
jgi:hypothetical protein